MATIEQKYVFDTRGKLSIIGVIILYVMNNIRVGMASTILLQADQTLGGPNTYSTFVTFATIIECMLVPFYLKMNAGYKMRRVLLMSGSVIFAAVFIMLSVVNNMVIFQWIYLLNAISSGLIKSACFSYINEVAGPTESAKWIGINGVAMSVSKLVNLGLGVAIDVGTYRLCTVLIAAAIVVGAVFVIFCSPKDTGYENTAAGTTFHFLPTLFFSAMLGSLLAAITFATNKRMPWGSTGNLILLAIFVISLCYTVYATRKLGDEAPMPLSVFKSKVFVMLMIISVLVTILTMPALIFMPVYMQTAMGTGATAAMVLTLVFMPVGLILSTPMSRHIAKNNTAKIWIIIEGILAIILGLFAAFVFHPGISLIVIYIWGVVQGYFNCFSPTAMPAAITKTVPEEVGAYGSPALAMTTPFGASLGTAIVMGLFQVQGAEAGKTPVFIAMAVIGAIVLILGILIPVYKKEK